MTSWLSLSASEEEQSWFDVNSVLEVFYDGGRDADLSGVVTTGLISEDFPAICDAMGIPVHPGIAPPPSLASSASAASAYLSPDMIDGGSMPDGAGGGAGGSRPSSRSSGVGGSGGGGGSAVEDAVRLQDRVLNIRGWHLDMGSLTALCKALPLAALLTDCRVFHCSMPLAGFRMLVATLKETSVQNVTFDWITFKEDDVQPPKEDAADVGDGAGGAEGDDATASGAAGSEGKSDGDGRGDGKKVEEAKGEGKRSDDDDKEDGKSVAVPAPSSAGKAAEDSDAETDTDADDDDYWEEGEDVAAEEEDLSVAFVELISESPFAAVSLRGNGITDSAASLLADALLVNRSLLSLGLYDNKIGDLGMLAILRALRYNRSLISLSLGKNDVTAASASALAQVLTSYELDDAGLEERARVEAVMEEAYNSGVAKKKRKKVVLPDMRELDAEEAAAIVAARSGSPAGDAGDSGDAGDGKERDGPPLPRAIVVGNRTLAALNLSGNPLGSSWGMAVCDRLPTAKPASSLRHLALQRTGVDAAALREALVDMTGLTLLC